MSINYEELLFKKEKPLSKAVQPRTKEFRKIHSRVINRNIRTNFDDPETCEGYYLYFGNQDYTKILPMLCQVNPFWASALTVDGDNDGRVPRVECLRQCIMPPIKVVLL